MDGLVPYDELLRLTDPALVTFEMDCGWVKVGRGGSGGVSAGECEPDLDAACEGFQGGGGGVSGGTRPEPAELGQGTMDMGAVLRAAMQERSSICLWSRRSLTCRRLSRCGWTAMSHAGAKGLSFWLRGEGEADSLREWQTRTQGRQQIPFAALLNDKQSNKATASASATADSLRE